MGKRGQMRYLLNNPSSETISQRMKSQRQCLIKDLSQHELGKEVIVSSDDSENHNHLDAI
jgi:hypothetical protein